MRIVFVLLALGLGLVWLAGLRVGATPWLVWLDFVAALLALGNAFMPAEAGGLVRASPIAIGVALLVLWIVALIVGAVPWLAWWTFAFGVAFVIFGLVSMGSRPIDRTTLRPTAP
jgi:hypothetical protein